MRQLISIKPDGSIKGLQFKGKGIDLRRFGKASINRVSEIDWCEDKQKWRIYFLQGMLCHTYVDISCLTHSLKLSRADENLILSKAHLGEHNVLLFDDYDTAVEAEVLLIQAAVKSGKANYVLY